MTPLYRTVRFFAVNQPERFVMKLPPACGKIALSNIASNARGMTASNLMATVLTVAYFAAAAIGFRRNLLSRTEMGLMIGIGVIAGAIILWLLLRPA